MNGRIRRFAATGAAAVVLGAGTMVFTAGAANAAEPVVIGSCATSVEGAPGTPVELSTGAVLAPVTNTVAAVPLVGPVLAGSVKGALNATPPIPIGAIPTGSGFISGGTIAHDVVGKLPVLGAALNPVSDTLTQMCGVAVHGVNAAAAPAQDGTKSLATRSQQLFSPNPHTGSPGGAGGPGGGGGGAMEGGPTGPGNGGGGRAHDTMPPPNMGLPEMAGLDGGVPFSGSLFSRLGMAESPTARYGDVPFATAGLFAPSPGVRYGGAVPGYAPRFDVLGKNQQQAKDQQDNPVRTAGRAEAIGGGPAPDGGGVGLALLFAVLALSGVTAALVRTWVLRTAKSTTTTSA